MRSRIPAKNHPLRTSCVPVEPACRPILFSGHMVRALLAGTKTQTRRIIKPQPPPEARSAGVIYSASKSNGTWSWLDSPDLEDASFVGKDFRCPYGVPGDTLWVRETWQTVFERHDGQRFTESRAGVQYARCWIEYAATADEPPPTWRPSIHMPRAYSRITLRITDVRVELLQDISEADALAEGICKVGDRWEADGICATPISAADAYRALWQHINGAGSWELNPWIWALDFERVESAKAAA